MKAAIYLRVSTDRQDELNQEPACQQACASRGWTPIVYREVQGGGKARPVWAGVLEAARRGDVGAVVIFSIHRIGRRRTQIAGDLADLARWGTAVVSVSEKFLDFDGSPEMAKVRDLLIQWWGWFAEMERAEIEARTRLSMAKIKEALATQGFYYARESGRRITSLGRPHSFGREWQARARALAREFPDANPPEIGRKIIEEGGPKISRGLIRTWIGYKAPQDDAVGG